LELLLFPIFVEWVPDVDDRAFHSYTTRHWDSNKPPSWQHFFFTNRSRLLVFHFPSFRKRTGPLIEEKRPFLASSRDPGANVTVWAPLWTPLMVGLAKTHNEGPGRGAKLNKVQKYVQTRGVPKRKHPSSLFLLLGKRGFPLLGEKGFLFWEKRKGIPFFWKRRKGRRVSWKS
jgi:hypothetical protein